MITDKDREELRELTRQIRSTKMDVVFFDHGWNECAEIIMRYVNKKCTESADQERKDVAERVACAWREHGEGITLRTIRDAILDDSTTNHIPDTGEKLHPEITNEYVKKLEDDLAIAVKALKEIKKIGKAGPAFETHFSKLQYIGAVTNDALKEIR